MLTPDAREVGHDDRRDGLSRLRKAVKRQTEVATDSRGIQTRGKLRHGGADRSAYRAADRVIDHAADVADRACHTADHITDRSAERTADAREIVADAADHAADLIRYISKRAARAADRVSDRAADVSYRSVDIASDIADRSVDCAADIADGTVDRAADIIDGAVDCAADIIDGAADFSRDIADRLSEAAALDAVYDVADRAARDVVEVVRHEVAHRAHRLIRHVVHQTAAERFRKVRGIGQLAQVAPRQAAEGILRRVCRHIRQGRHLLLAPVVAVFQRVRELVVRQSSHRVAEHILAHAHQLAADRRTCGGGSRNEDVLAVCVPVAVERTVVVDQIVRARGDDLAAHFNADLRQLSEQLRACRRGDGSCRRACKAADRACDRAHQDRVAAGVKDLSRALSLHDTRHHRNGGARGGGYCGSLCRYEEQRRRRASRKDRERRESRDDDNADDDLDDRLPVLDDEVLGRRPRLLRAVDHPVDRLFERARDRFSRLLERVLDALPYRLFLRRRWRYRPRIRFIEQCV